MVQSCMPWALAPPRANFNSRRTVASEGRSGWKSTKREGTLLSSVPMRATTNCMTFAVPSRPRLFLSVIRSPTAYLEKSITTSNRSACEIAMRSWLTGCGSRPRSLPIWTNDGLRGALGPAVAHSAARSTIQYSESVAGVCHLKDRPRCTVDQNAVAQHAADEVPFGSGCVAEGGVDGRVVEGSVLSEGLVADHQRDVALAMRQPEPLLLVIPDEVEPGESLVDLRPGEVHPVIVVPECGCRLVNRIGVLLRPFMHAVPMTPAVIAAGPATNWGDHVGRIAHRRQQQTVAAPLPSRDSQELCSSALPRSQPRSLHRFRSGNEGACWWPAFQFAGFERGDCLGCATKCGDAIRRRL